MDRPKGLIFDADGVVLDMPHEKVWREAVKAYGIEEFTTADYDALASGVSRRDACKSILKHFDVDYDDLVIEELYHLKQEITERFICQGKLKFFGSALNLILDAKEYDVKVSIASSSENAGRALRSARLRDHVKCNEYETIADIFDDIISGGVNPGKPDPKIFLSSAEHLGVEPTESIVFEDAVSGVKAAKAGGFYCVGVDRTGISLGLRAEGADIVVPDLRGLSYIELCLIYGGREK